jgi:hypothetical protein
MNLLYHTKTESWYCPESGWHLGSETVQAGAPSHSCRFFVQKKGNKLGPLIGILTSSSAEEKIYGDWKRFASIQHEFQKKGGISFIFTPQGMKEHYIEGHVLLTDQRWRKCRFPQPDAIYNRIPYRSHEVSDSCQQALAIFKEKRIPVFNPGFFSKWDVHQALQKNTVLQEHLLHTEPLYKQETLLRMLRMYQTVYVKQADAAKGKHIFRLQHAANSILLQPVHGEPRIMTSEEVWDFIEQQNRLLLVQPSLLHDEQEGKKYDLRILSHFLEDSFKITGIGVRIAAPGCIVTHVPNGGTITPVHQLSRPLQYKKLEYIVQECGKSLCDAFGHVREFSLDVGIDQQGNYYIFEANAKPMRFDEPEIERKALQNLILVFEQEAGFSSYHDVMLP